MPWFMWVIVIQAGVMGGILALALIYRTALQYQKDTSNMWKDLYWEFYYTIYPKPEVGGTTK